MKFREWFDYFCGACIIVACIFVVNNLMYRLPAQVALLQKQAHDAQDAASKASAIANAALRESHKKTITALTQSQRYSLKPMKEQITRQQEFESKLYDWLEAQQEEIRTIQREVEAR